MEGTRPPNFLDPEGDWGTAPKFLDNAANFVPLHSFVPVFSKIPGQEYHFLPVQFRLCYCSINCLFINILNFPNWQAVKRKPFGYLYLSTTALTLASLAVYLQITYSSLSSAI